MKKIYSFIAFMVLAVCAFAQNGAPLYLTGDCDASKWNPGAPLEFTYADGQYTLEVTGIAQFKLSTSKGTWDEFNKGSMNCPKLYTGETQTLYPGDANILLGWKGDYKLTVAGDLSTITAYTETPNPNEGKFPSLYIRGTFNDWGTDTPLNTEDGVIYVANNINMGQDAEFKIADGDWAEYNFGSVADIVVGTTYTLSGGNTATNCTLAMPLVNATFTFNLENETLLIQGEGDVPVVIKKLYIVGENYGNWARDNQYMMTIDSAEDGQPKVYSIVLPYLTGEWKIFDGTWSYSFGMGLDDVELNKDIEVFFNSSVNFSSNIEKPVCLTLTIPVGADVDGSSEPAYIKVTTLDDEPVVPLAAPEKLYMLGTVNGTSWSLTGAPEFTKDGNVFTIATLEINDSGYGFGYFYLSSKIATEWSEIDAATRYGSRVNGEYMDDQLPGRIIEYPAGKVCATWTSVAGNYSVKADFDNCSLEFTLLDGVADIEADDNAPAVYFNLQGQQVNNPASGLYIRKAGSKVSKVYIFK